MPLSKITLLSSVLALAITGCVQVTVPSSGSGPVAAAQPTGSSASCSSAPLGSEFDRPVDRANFDQTTLNRAILHFTNERRCANGINALAADSALDRAARGHTAEMVSMNFFGHNSPNPQNATMKQRLDAQGASYRTAAENLALRSRLQMQSGRRFTVGNAATCDFSYGGQRIEAHSYRSLAQDIVRDWENSPGHRTNLMNSRYTRLGVGSALKPNAQNCGDVLATQNFAA